MNLIDPLQSGFAAQLKAQPLLPTSLKSSELQKEASAALRERAFFSARVGNATVLQAFKDAVGEIVEGQKNVADQRAELKLLGARLGYDPGEKAAGSITDWFSNKRLNLILETNTAMTRGFGQWREGNAEGALEAYPAQELVRVSLRAEPRDWPTLWDEAADELGDTTSATDGDSGRLVALKNDPIWEAISDFGLPYPPFKFNSGMGLRDVSYEEAVELGVMEEQDEPLAPPARGLNTGLQASADEFDPPFAQVLAEGMSDLITFTGGLLRFKNSAICPAQQRDRGEAVLAALINAGTSEGAKKGWETRRRGGAPVPAMSKHRAKLLKLQSDHERIVSRLKKEHDLAEARYNELEKLRKDPANAGKLSQIKRWQEAASKRFFASSKEIHQRQTILIERARAAIETPQSERGSTRYESYNIDHPSVSGGVDIIERYASRKLDTNTITIRASVDDQRHFEFDHTRRSYCDSREVFIAPNADASTVAHEIGHMLEHRHPAIIRANQEFLARRTAGDELQPLSKLEPQRKYGPSEITKPDKFHSAYVGRIYPNGSTEVLSMGIERLHKNPLEFATNDPDYFDHILKVLKGGYIK